MSDLWIYGSSFSKENHRKLIRKVVPKMRVTGLSRLVENYARKSCRAFPLEDKDDYRSVVFGFCSVSSCKSHVLRYESFSSSRGRGIIISSGSEFVLVRLFCLFFILHI